MGFKDYAGYLATIPEPPEYDGSPFAPQLVLVDPRVDFERICREGIVGFSASSLKECHHADVGQPKDRPYWILVELVENPEGHLIRETIKKTVDSEKRGCIFMEGLAIRIQKGAEPDVRPLVLPGSRYYDPPDDRHFCGALNSNKQFVPFCTDARSHTLVAVTDGRVYT